MSSEKVVELELDQQSSSSMRTDQEDQHPTSPSGPPTQSTDSKVIASTTIRNPDHGETPTIIECGEFDDEKNVWVHKNYDEFFQYEVEIFRAKEDVLRRRLYRPSEVAKRVGCPSSRIGMFLNRKRKCLRGIFLATGYTNKPSNTFGLKIGAYFVTVEVCKRIERHFMNSKRRMKLRKREIDHFGSSATGFLQPPTTIHSVGMDGLSYDVSQLQPRLQESLPSYQMIPFLAPSSRVSHQVPMPPTAAYHPADLRATTAYQFRTNPPQSVAFQGYNQAPSALINGNPTTVQQMQQMQQMISIAPQGMGPQQINFIPSAFISQPVLHQTNNLTASHPSTMIHSTPVSPGDFIPGSYATDQMQMNAPFYISLLKSDNPGIQVQQTAHPGGIAVYYRPNSGPQSFGVPLDTNASLSACPDEFRFAIHSWLGHAQQ